MATNNDNYDERARQAVAEALMSEDTSVSEAAIQAEGLDPKAFFCSNWESIKAVLQFLKKFLPALLRPVIDLIIKAGDAAHRVICG
ncbi:MAG: hypothetical protein JOZ90_03695 [Alphaproteobacteria bacterium]|nr:hypothetical protein [Alphaproteobacteria bacterium]MBV9372667.1 hypothetical protein [Alphaproteobacteria bacterium]MBV9900183.1 hypothetical protein [Alphaproteobacteria bacterium]